jgi:protein-disulfide isomerase
MQLSGMDEAAFEACLKREDLSKAIFDSATKARTEFGIKGTPAIFINGKMVDGHKDFAEIKSVIDAALSQ